MLIVTASFSMPIEEVINYSRDDLLHQVLFEVHTYFVRNIGGAKVLSENFHRSDDSVKVILEIEPTSLDNEKEIHNSALLLKQWGRGAFNRSFVTVKKLGKVDLSVVSNESMDIGIQTTGVENATTLYVVFDKPFENKEVVLTASRPTLVRDIDMAIYSYLLADGMKPIHQEICITPRESESTLTTIMVVVPTRDERSIVSIKSSINSILSHFYSKVVITHYHSVEGDLVSL